jgi:hypothetical protein
MEGRVWECFMSIYDGGGAGMSSISREELTGVIRGVIEFTENRGEYEDTKQWVPQLVEMKQKVNLDAIFVSEENLVLLMQCRKDVQEYWEGVSAKLRERDSEDYKVVQLRLDGVISKMQLCVLLEKLKAWCV